MGQAADFHCWFPRPWSLPWLQHELPNEVNLEIENFLRD